MNNNVIIKSMIDITRELSKNILTVDQKKIIKAVLKNRNVKAYDGEDILKVFIKKK